MENQEIFQNRIDLSELQNSVNKIREEISKVIVGQKKMVDLMLVAILSDGHVIIEGVPGIAKTLTAKLMAKMLSVEFSRIQFTPDLMPSDITGTSVFHFNKSAFEFNKGPVFSNIVLIDEINRAPAKTQSALFEVMEERQVTVDGKTYLMAEPFLVFATQNPIEQEGTYRLPEAQLDRFIFKINLDYPSLEEEEIIINRSHERKNRKELEDVSKVLNASQIIDYQQKIRQIHVEPKLIRYIAEIINQTRHNPAIYLGASPRASINLLLASKAYAAMQGRDFIIPEDIREMTLPVLNHRIYLTPEKELEGTTTKDIIDLILQTVEVPR